MDGLQLGRDRGLAHAAGRSEKLLEAAIHQGSDFIADDDARPLEKLRFVAAILDHGGNPAAAHFDAPPFDGRAGLESGCLELLYELLEADFLGAVAAEEHRRHYNCPMPFVLSLDEGTTSARAGVYDQQGRRVSLKARALECSYPQTGWVEQDAERIWQLQKEVAREALQAAGIAAADITALGITNQRETVVVWDKATGVPIAPAIVWQCRRTAADCAELKASSDAAWIEQRTGLVIDAYFSASKLRWLLRHVEGAAARAANGELLFGNIDTWLIWKLTNGRCHATDVTNASRTMLMNLETAEWDDDLLRVFEVPRCDASEDRAIERR